MPATLAQTVRAFTEEAVFLARSAAEAEEIQWTAAPIPKPREDTTERSKGGPHGDPTLDTVLDERRLAVRLRYEEAHVVLQELTSQARDARRNLDAAIASWNGETPA